MADRRVCALPALLLASVIAGCSPSQLAPMPLRALATMIDSAQSEHAPNRAVDWSAVVGAHDAHLERWEALRRDGAAVWALRPLEMEAIVGEGSDGGNGEDHAPPAAFGPWSGLLRRSHSIDRHLHDDLLHGRAAHPDAIATAMLRRRAESGIAALAAEANEPVARAMTDLRRWVRLAADDEVPAAAAERLAIHERGQAMYVDALEEALLDYLRHFTPDGTWRGGTAAHDGPDGGPPPIPRVAWDSIVRVIAITDTMVRQLEDSSRAILDRLDGSGRRNFMMWMSFLVGGIEMPDDEPNLVESDDFVNALLAIAALLGSEGAAQAPAGAPAPAAAAVDPLLRDRLTAVLEAESALAGRATLLVAWLSMAESLETQPRLASETVPAALRHLESAVVRDTLVSVQRDRQRNVLRAQEILSERFDEETLTTLVDAATASFEARVQDEPGLASTPSDATGAWRSLPQPEPWRRIGAEGAPKPFAGAGAESIGDHMVDIGQTESGHNGEADDPPLVRMALGHLLEPALSLLPADESERVARAIAETLATHRPQVDAAVESARAWVAANLLPGEWPHPRVLDDAAAAVEAEAAVRIADVTGRPLDDPLLACLRLDWALARLAPERGFGTSEARRDHAVSPTVIVAAAPPEQRGALASGVAPFVDRVIVSADHALAALEHVAVIMKRESITDETSSKAATKRLSRTPGARARDADGEADMPPALRAAVRDAESALAAHAALLADAVAHTLDALPVAVKPRVQLAWMDAAYPMSAFDGAVPDAVDLCRRAVDARLDRHGRARGDGADDGEGDTIVALLEASDDTASRVFAWRLRAIEASRSLPFIPIGKPSDAQLRTREDALWARHRLLESHIRGALLALQHADESVAAEIRAALGWRAAP